MKVEPANKGVLYIVSTPIGNLEDITLRALRILKEVDIIVAEDTRWTRKLLSRYQIHVSLISCHEHNQVEKSEELLEKLRSGIKAALVTDAGTPGISDPGYYIIRVAIENGVRVIPIPGVSAVIAALSVSGLPADSFSFLGFLPRQSSRRKAILQKLRYEKRVFVIYESPKRLLATLRDILDESGDRKMLLARELTKKFEELKWGMLSEVLDDLEGKDIRGEITLVFEGSREQEVFDEDTILDTIRWYRENTDLKLSGIVRKVAEEVGVSKTEVYRLGLKLRKADSS